MASPITATEQGAMPGSARPPAIQSHGALLSLGETDLTIRHASENSGDWLGVSTPELLGAPLGSIFDDDSRVRLLAALASQDPAELSPLKLRPRRTLEIYDVTVQRVDGLVILELERADLAADASLARLQRWILGTLARLRAAPGAQELATLAAEAIRTLTGFDRVTVFRRSSEGSAASAVASEPPGDRPAWTAPACQSSSMIADVAAPSVSITGEQPVPPLLSARALLRAPLQLECERLRGMGMAAAFETLLVVDERPWGILACHHRSARAVSSEVRQAVEVVCEALMGRMTALERSAVFERQAKGHRLLASLIDQMSMHAHPIAGLASSERAVLDLAGADGAVLSYEGTTARLGKAPDDVHVQRLAAWLASTASLDGPGVFASRELATERPEAPELPGTSGVLAVAIGAREKEFLFWFRATGRGEPWEASQIDVALELRNVVLGSIGKRAKELVQLNEELRASSFAKDEFLATVSHELRTPLNAMLGWLHLLESQDLPEAKRAQALEVIARNARSQAKLIEDLLDVSRITSGKMRLDVQAMELAPVVEAAVQSVRPAVEAKGIKLELNLARDAGVVRGDAQRLQQVVWNLLTNAVKFTPRNGRIRVELERIDGYVALAVSDDGSGIPLEFLPHVFERFRQAEASSRRIYKGLGLGLAIVKHLVELHGGQVTASSPGEGQGATFVVNLPLAPVQEAPSPVSRRRSDPVERTTRELAGLRVLVVDDEPDATDLLVAILTRAGMSATPANAGMEALEQLQRGHFDILLSDVGMPGMDGIDLVRRVRALPAERGGRIPAVALTAFTRGQDRTRAFLAGFDLYLPKPVDPDELLALLGSLAGRMRKSPAESSSEPPVQPRDSVPALASGPLSGVRALFVEAAANRDGGLAAGLREAGAQLEIASDAAGARLTAQRFRPELLVTDVELPDQDGYELLRQLRASGAEQGGWIPAVALVPAGSAEAGRKALLAGFQLYLHRPVEADVLVSRLARLVAWTVRRT